jgi:outer membrane protein assembly complex protein YaeT
VTIDRPSALPTQRRPPRRFLRLGILSLLLVCAACVRQPGAAGGPYPGFAQYEGEAVQSVAFVGPVVLPQDSLRAVVVVHPPVCRISFLPGWACFAGKRTYQLNLGDLAADVLRLQLYYRDHGYYGSRVTPGVTPEGGGVAVRFSIVPGDRVRLSDVEVHGTEEIVPPAQLESRLPLQAGEPFGRIEFLASADSIRAELNRRGYAYAEVLRNYSIDTVTDVAQASYEAVPGPLVHVDSIRVVGNDRLSRRTILKQMTVHQGSLLQLSDLATSQRNLYNLSIVNFASVALAPDTSQVDADSATATVAVRIVEAPKYRTDATVGYGSVDCLRAGVQLTDRNFLGGGRTLQLSASTSKIGAGDVLSVGNLCTPGSDSLARKLNYRFAADFLQPRLLGTRTQLSANLHVERQSDLSLYLRRSVGGQLQVSREVAPSVVVGTGLQVDRASTEATSAIFCVVFTACTEQERRPLTASRWSNVATLSAAWNRTRTVGQTARGFSITTAMAWSAPALQSTDRYLSVIADAVGYYPLRPGWVLAGRVQGGTFLSGSLGLANQYIPPERRFYAGGPNSIRGFPVNGLGPQAYVASPLNYNADGSIDGGSVQRYPLGGTRVAVGSVELRMPSPWLSQYLRWAAFVDAGQVWAPGLSTADRVAVSSGHMVVTPGMGVRITTPVGPIRVDVGYNPYGARPGPLYEVPTDAGGHSTGDLVPVEPYYQPSAGTFLNRLQFQIAVGQAF